MFNKIENKHYYPTSPFIFVFSYIAIRPGFVTLQNVGWLNVPERHVLRMTSRNEFSVWLLTTNLTVHFCVFIRSNPTRICYSPKCWVIKCTITHPPCPQNDVFVHHVLFPALDCVFIKCTRAPCPQNDVFVHHVLLPALVFIFVFSDVALRPGSGWRHNTCRSVK